MRPRGELVWVHAAEERNVRAVADMAEQLASQRPGCHALLTTTAEQEPPPPRDGVLHAEMPEDHPELVTQFVAHWNPDVVVWTWGGLRPNAIIEAKRSGAHMLLVDAARDGFDRRRDRWLPEVPRRLLSQFDVVMARSQPAYARLAQLGLPLSDVEVTKPLRPFGQTLPAVDSDVVELTEALAGRPVWLAAHVERDEIGVVLSAHRQALKASHRLLLILQLADPKHTAGAIEWVHERGMRTALWSDGELPEESVQVLTTDFDDELGLWLRIAPIAFFGGSLNDHTEDHDPYVASAHGTAVIYGPYVTRHAEAYRRLLSSGAARIINDASSLGLAVTQMIAPDRAAEMAVAGWEVMTEGAEGLDRIVQRVHAYLDAKQDGQV